MGEKTQIEDLVSLLDHFMEKGGGHMNVDTDQTRTNVRISEKKSNECSVGKWATACAVPTLMEGLDRDDDKMTGGNENGSK